MGQKANPTGMRVGINKNWKSLWYSKKEDYAKNLEKDLKIREYLRERLSSAGLEEIIIKRYSSKTEIQLYVARPGVVIGRGGSGIEETKKELNKKFNEAIEIKIFEVKKPDISSRLIAENIANQLERRVIPKFICKKIIDQAKESREIKGIRVWIAGRIKGAEIARTEKFQWGTVPLQTLRADIDYTSISAQVPNAGKHGVKVWVYKGEKHSYKLND